MTTKTTTTTKRKRTPVPKNKDILYSYVKKVNKSWVTKQAKKADVRASKFVDIVLDAARKGKIEIGTTITK